jgi:hypothetical protein
MDVVTRVLVYIILILLTLQERIEVIFILSPESLQIKSVEPSDDQARFNQ